MNRTARGIAVSAAATVVTLSMAAPAAVAHDGYGSHDGDRDRYSTSYDRDRDGYGGDRERDGDRYDGDHDGDRYGGDREGYRHRHDGVRDGDRYDVERHRWDGDLSDDEGDGYKSDRTEGAPRDGVRHARWDNEAGRHGSEVAFTQQKRAMLAYLDRADAFLAGLTDRVSDSDLDPALKSTLMGLIESRLATIADLRQKVQAATSLEDLRALRTTSHTDAHL